MRKNSFLAKLARAMTFAALFALVPVADSDAGKVVTASKTGSFPQIG